MARNRVSLSQSPRYEPPEIEPFSKVEARRVLDVAATRNSARWSVALALGLRQGETVGLGWSDVNIDEARLLIRVQLSTRPGSTAV
jgi:integrase